MNNQLIEELYKTIEAKDNIINNQTLEIARLKDREKEIMDKYFYQSKYASEMEDRYITENAKVKEAIKYIDIETKGCDEEPIEGSWLYDLYAIRDILGEKENE